METIVTGAFDDLRSRDLRFLQEASKPGPLTVLLWDDEAVQAMTGRPPRFPLAERLYFLRAIRYVARVLPQQLPPAPNTLPGVERFRGALWIDRASEAIAPRQRFCQIHGLKYRVLADDDLAGFPNSEPVPSPTARKKVVATGCYDWLHSGHVRFFEEVSAYGDLYVIVGHDSNIRLLKGEGHPLLGEGERRFMVASIRYVTQALVSSGQGWLDADPEIQRLKPDIYAVNEDGDRGGKRDYCKQHGIDYLVLRRVPAPGLPSRSSTVLRGF